MAICNPQPFDAEFLGGPVYRLELDAVDCLRSLPDQMPRDAILVSMRIPSDWPAPDPATGFRLIETTVQMRRDPDPEDAGEPAAEIRLARPEDAEACADIARTVFTADRYHADPMIADPLADKMKAVWARNDINGRADRTFVWEESGAVIGFVGCLKYRQSVTIDLIAVADGHHGRGIGRALLRAAFSHYLKDSDCREILIATQANNHGALALYRALGFKETGRLRTYHFTPAPIGLGTAEVAPVS